MHMNEYSAQRRKILYRFHGGSSSIFFIDKKEDVVKIFDNHSLEVSTSTTRSDFIKELSNFGYFSELEFGCKDGTQGMFFVREHGFISVNQSQRTNVPLFLRFTYDQNE